MSEEITGTAETAEITETAPPQTGAGGQPQPEKTSYTKEEVSQIVQERLKSWQSFGKPEELQTRLSRADQLERFYAGLSQHMGNSGQYPGQNQQAPETEEDKKVRAYMERMYPGLGKMNEDKMAIQQAMQTMQQRQWQAITSNSQAALRDMAVKAGYKEEQLAGPEGIEQRVADSIRGNQKDLADYMRTGDPGIVKRHFQALDNWIKGFSAAPVATQTAQYAAAKHKTSALPPRIPPGGVPAPTASKAKLTNEERISAAFEAFKKG